MLKNLCTNHYVHKMLPLQVASHDCAPKVN